MCSDSMERGHGDSGFQTLTALTTMCLCIWLVLICSLYIKTVTRSMASSVSHSSKLLKLLGSWEPLDL